jgi:putative ATPase
MAKKKRRSTKAEPTPPPDERERAASAPLADRMRPRTFDEFVGQAKIVGPDSLLRRAIESDNLSSVILWGPPGSGKTSLARIIAGVTGAHYAAFSAVVSGVAEVRSTIADARERLQREKKRTILFVDEIHRFNKAQQDAFLPHVEAGTIVLVGATTENPSFEVISALLSRCRVFKLEPLRPEEIKSLLRRAVEDRERGLGAVKAAIDEDALDFLVNYSNGDARSALSALEFAVTAGRLRADGSRRVTRAVAEEAMQRKAVLYDKGGEEHYNIISALHKSLRGSDPQGALYWLGRMLEGGEDPLYILRRLVRFAAEDVGLADPQALSVAVAAKEAYDFVGMPEGDLFLGELVVYLAAAPKSNSVYAALGAVREDIRKYEAAPVPLHIRNAPTRLMKEFGYGKGYRYDHDEPGHISAQEYLPDVLKGHVYYRPGEYGFEREMAKRIAYWEKLRARAQSDESEPGDDDAPLPENDGEPPLV